jgi:L-histidine Nalpha-methyltransferase
MLRTDDFPQVRADVLPRSSADPAFRHDVVRGLEARPRVIPPRWFYDHDGSALFEQITELPEYYVTRTERALLQSAAAEIAAHIGPGRAIVEFGAGSCSKTPILLRAVDPMAYVPIDISGDFLRESAAKLSAIFPGLAIHPIEGDFTNGVRLPPEVEERRRLGFFPGSTIGNMLVPDALNLLRAMASTLGDGSMLLIGVDRIKDPSILVPAYDDSAGVTAAFNRNILHRVNRELRGTIPVDAFRHLARWNDNEARMEMHLKAERDVEFGVDGHFFCMAEGETIHTENSLKYGARDVAVLLRAGGWSPVTTWTDPKELFTIVLAQATGLRPGA